MAHDTSSDRVAIAAVMARYNANGDRGRIGELGACFLEDGVLKNDSEEMIGREAIVARLGAGRGAHGREQQFGIVLDEVGGLVHGQTGTE